MEIKPLKATLADQMAQEKARAKQLAKEVADKIMRTHKLVILSDGDAQIEIGLRTSYN